MSANHLIHEKSPYLLQHSENPVDWYPWGEEAFLKAKTENKPVFVSIGYATCHWCHVMERESFEDLEVAALLNRDFVAVKVDREERPDVDAVYMDVCQAMTGSGGWPLTIVMTPEQQPFFAGTYFPKRSGFGKPGLMEVLTEVSRLWESDRERIFGAAREIAAFAARDRSGPGAVPGKDVLRRAAALFRESFDAGYGGFGPAPKFPLPHNLLFLFTYAALEGDDDARRMAEYTLTQMGRGGIFDQVGGGFSRYSTDVMWLVPHFEKMLYDNALLLYTYLTAYESSGFSFFRTVADKTFAYVLRELTDSAGGFFCGQDADSEGVEGRYYVFSPEELRGVLGEEEGRLFCEWFDVTKRGNFSGKSVPNLLQNSRFATPDARMEEVCLRVRKFREQRATLLTDDKVLTAWNGLMIAALAKGFGVLGERRYLSAAERCRRFVMEELCDEAWRLQVRWREGEAAHAGQLADYAFFAWGLLELYAVSGDASCVRDAARFAGVMADLFLDAENGGFFLYASDAEQLIARPKEVFDGAVPSGNSIAGLVLVRLARLTGEGRWRDLADRQCSFLAGSAARYPTGSSAALLALAEVLYPGGEVVCCLAEGESADAVLRLGSRYRAAVLVKTRENADVLAEAAPFSAVYPVPGEGMQLYFCREGACSLPVATPAELERLITSLPVSPGFNG